MKRYFIALFILPLLLVACDDDKLEMMPPYIFFNYDVDTYVMDIDNPNLADFTVKGSISAQGSFGSFVMGDQELGKEELGDSLNRPFEYIVPLKGKTADFDVPFDRRRLQSAGNCRELSPRCDDALAHAGPAGGKRAFGAAY